MKASIYLSYTTRSLRRGGQRTLLAIFCIAVGVMAIIALQLVGEMINHSLVGNIRDANGGDVAVSSYSSSIQHSELTFFDQLKQENTITAYTPVVSTSGSTGLKTSISQSFPVLVVDPDTYPIGTAPTVREPAGVKLASLLKDRQVVIDQVFADQQNKSVGNRFRIYLSTYAQGSVVIDAKVAGIIANDGVLQGQKGVLLFSLQDYQAAAPDVAMTYTSVYVATANTEQAVKEIKQKFTLENVQTPQDTAKNFESQMGSMKKFLAVAGLLALLIGGVGIVNTMQVLLSRRKTEIAMLKTVGYRRFDLYLLFGLEATLLGLIGGIVGAALAIGLSALSLSLLYTLFQISVPFLLDWGIVGSGLLIGVCTALIFGLLPIVQAANIRPLNVIRELPENQRASSVLLSIGLLLLLSVLFCVMAVLLLNDVLLGIGAVYGAFLFLGLLSLFFTLVVLIISILPVPERFSFGYLSLILGAVLLSVLLTLVLPAFGVLLLIVSLMGIVVVVLPRSWKVNVKMALRNIGRQRVRTTTTLLALFVGVFTIGLILVLGQNLRDQFNKFMAENLTFNVLTITRGDDTDTLRARLDSVAGLTQTQERTYTSVRPESIDGQELGTLMADSSEQASFDSLPPAVAALYLSSLEGFDVANNKLPDRQIVTIVNGRNLQPGDAGSDNVLVNELLTTLKPLKGHIQVGSKITLVGLDGVTRKTVTVVGFYRNTGLSGTYGLLLTAQATVEALTPAQQQTSIFYMKIDAEQVGKALSTIERITPEASVFNFANVGDVVNQYLGNIMLVLTALASLSLLAGLIIIANAVALAMLERRRELGILKSVGYTSRSLLSEVLIENGIVGGTGALLAMLIVTLVSSLLGRLVFESDFGVSWYIAIGLIGGVALIAMVTASLVAWGAVRIRPLEVLRYE